MKSLRHTLRYEPRELAFGTSGLRGLIADMTDLECYVNVLGFLEYLKRQGFIGQEVYLAGDLRFSTPRIMCAVAKAVETSGQKLINCGFIPTPALAAFALANNAPSIMVTGSHIPDNRNGIKFYKISGEVLKVDEAEIRQAVAYIREQTYNQTPEDSLFNSNGGLKNSVTLPRVENEAERQFVKRFTELFNAQTLSGKTVVLYQHSAVGRDMLKQLLESLGADVICEGRSDKFIPMDSENVTAADQAYFHQLAVKHAGCFAIVSTDGDSDRPFVIDERGVFHRGDELGALIATWLKADSVAVPVSSNDGVGRFMEENKIPIALTKIGSPHVIVAMQEAVNRGSERPVGWEVNGGFLTGADVALGEGTLPALPTRDAFLPILGALLLAIERKLTISKMFESLPKRFTQAGLIDNFPPEISQKMVDVYQNNSEEISIELGRYFTAQRGFGKVLEINNLDGVRIYFDNDEIAHFRPSGNAPQLRMYSVAATQARADEIVEQAIAEPDGIFRKLQDSLK